jgi:hypothetical protein
MQLPYALLQPKDARIDKRFLHRRGRSKEDSIWTANSLETADMVRYLDAGRL